MLSGLFSARTFLDADVEAWHLDVWGILIDRFGDDLSLADTPAALPTRDFFPPTGATGHGKALHVLSCVRSIMQMPETNWPCALVQQSPTTTGARVDEFLHIAGDPGPGGTFQIGDDGAVTITYAPELVDDPMGLVATLAHEMAHYLLVGEVDLVEDDTHELMTDLMVAYVGLGVFGANAAFSFQQHGDAFGQGWSARSAGYLSPRSWAFALAVFGELRGDDGGMGRYLKPEIEGLRRQAIRYLGKRPNLLSNLRRSR